MKAILDIYNPIGQAIMHMLVALSEPLMKNHPNLYFSFKKIVTPDKPDGVQVRLYQLQNADASQPTVPHSGRLAIIDKTFNNSYRVFSVAFSDATDLDNVKAFALHYEAPQALDVALLIIRFLMLGAAQEELIAQLKPFDLAYAYASKEQIEALEREAPPQDAPEADNTTQARSFHS